MREKMADEFGVSRKSMFAERAQAAVEQVNTIDFEYWEESITASAIDKHWKIRIAAVKSG